MGAGRRYFLFRASFHTDRYSKNNPVQSGLIAIAAIRTLAGDIRQFQHGISSQKAANVADC